MAELRLAPKPRVLFFVEGNTDIRFVVGLSEICDLTMAVPARAYEESTLKARVAACGARLQVHDDLYNGLREEIEEATRILLSRGWGPDKVLAEALVEGMRIVGIDFRDGILFVPEVLLAANAMKGGMAILRPLLASSWGRRIHVGVVREKRPDVSEWHLQVVAPAIPRQQEAAEASERGMVQEIADAVVNLEVRRFAACAHMWRLGGHGRAHHDRPPERSLNQSRHDESEGRGLTAGDTARRRPWRVRRGRVQCRRRASRPWRP